MTQGSPTPTATRPQTAIELTETLGHLAKLVSFDTQNPPRAITVDSEIFSYLKQQLRGFEISLLDAGSGCICLLAVRGTPELLFNFHIDTVPVAANWQVDPFTLIVDQHKATAIGACDIKGAAACMLTAVNNTAGDVALLFSSDEEHGSSAAVKHFLNSPDGSRFKKVIVAEPTQAKAVLAHRGILSAKAEFSGISGHASESRALQDNAIHKAATWVSQALDWVVGLADTRVDNLHGLPFNIGKINGGIKNNMIAADCEVTFGCRPLPGQNADDLLSQLAALAGATAQLTPSFYGPTLPSGNQPFAQALADAKQMAQDHGIPIGPAVSFWTEASLFSQAGCTALVFGPGDIRQAHTADEWVALTQLQQVEQAYCHIIAQSSL